MARPAGSPKTPGSGRQKGTKNKRTIQTREALQRYLDSQGSDPFQVLVDTMHTTADEKLKVTCASVLADRLLPKLKAVELSGDPDKPLYLQFTPEQRARRIAELTAKLAAHQNGHEPTT